MMGLFKTLKNMVRGWGNDLDKALADPERDGELGIKDAEAQIIQFRSNIAKLMADTKLHEKRLVEAQKKEEQWQSVLDRAIDANNEEDAKKAHSELQLASTKVENLKQQIEKNTKLTTKFRSDLEKLNTKVQSSKSKLASLKATNQSSNLRIELAKAHESINDGSSPFAALDKFENDVEAKESEAESWEELAGEGDSTQNLLDKYESKDDGFDFAALKKERKTTKKK